MIFLLVIMNLWAREVVIQSEQTSDIRYRKHLLENPQSQSFIQYHTSQKTDLTYELLNELKLGQFHFLNGNLEKALEHFKKMAELQHQANWDSRERDGIHYALMRLSQLEKDKAQKQSWLKQAVAFEYGKEPDPKLFPPPLIEDYGKLRKKMIQYVWQLPKQADLFDRVFVNGKSQKGHSGFIKTVGAVQRIQFLSNRYLPVYYVTHPKQLGKLIIKPVALAQGSCHRPVLNKDINPGWKWSYLLDDCVSNSRDEGRPALVQKPSHRQNQINQQVSVDTEKTKGKKKIGFYESKWFWVGLSVLATGFAFQSFEQNRKNQSQPRQVPVFKNYGKSK